MENYQMNLFKKLFGGKSKPRKEEVNVEEVAKKLNQSRDPLDIVSRHNSNGNGWNTSKEISLKKASDFALAVENIEDKSGVISGRAEDAAISDCATSSFGMAENSYSVPDSVASWYQAQGFIGYQMCALLAQHWLVDKACSQSIEDAVRNGWQLKPDAGAVLSNEQKAELEDFDIKHKVKENLMEYGRFANVFGIRVAIFVVESSDPEYYTKPFNEDGITPGSYKGISQIDPYWMTPMLTNESMSNPAAIGFYEPDYWIINGTRYHKSHLSIARGPQPADILKPTYIFGGIPLTQRIYERVYAAERTANEAPQLAMSKRTTAIHVDLDKVAANEQSFVERLMNWVRYRDNYGVKVLGKEETMEQFDVSLSDFDAVIMNQFQIASAVAKTPATKIMGTSPKGFNATGEFETVSYHEELESIQERWLTPLLNRHYLCAQKSLGLPFGLNVVWEPVDTMSSEKQADINSKKVTDAVAMVTSGMISPDEGRDKLAQDRDSGWNNLSLNDDANMEMGASPSNIAELEKAGAKATQVEKLPDDGGKEGKAPGNSPTQGLSTDVMDEAEGILDPNLIRALGNMKRALEGVVDKHTVPDNDRHFSGDANEMRTTRPTVERIDATVPSLAAEIGPKDEADLPKMRIAGITAVIENPRGSVRKGTSVDGDWQVKMPHHYGFIKNTVGSDGDEIDCFIGPNPKSGRVFVVNQNDPNSGDFDEHKVMLGFNNAAAAKKGFLSSRDDGKKAFGSMSEISMDEFRKWTQSSAEEQPLDGPYLESHDTDGPKQG